MKTYALWLEDGPDGDEPIAAHCCWAMVFDILKDRLNEDLKLDRKAKYVVVDEEDMTAVNTITVEPVG